MLKKISASIMAACLLAVSLLGIFADAAYVNGSKLGNVTLTAASTEQLGEGLSYNEFSYKDSSNKNQNIFTLEFNPKSSAYMPYMYHKNAGAGVLTLDDCKGAASEGLNVLGGVNADFFSMNTASYGTSIGMYVTDGKIASSTVGLAGYVLAFDSDGKADIVSSALSYKVFIGEEEWTYSGNTVLSQINKRADTWGNSIYYFDKSCGSRSDSVDLGTEVICKKLNGTDLAIGGTMQAEVVEVKKSTSGNNFDPETQFILYIKNGSPIQARANELKAGDKLSIEVDETVEEAKSVMRKANTAVYAPILVVMDGKNNVGSPTWNDLNVQATNANRTALGIKADGTVILFACEGRVDGNGLSFTALGDLLVSMGCVSAVNLDGGGSTTMVIKENNAYTVKYGSGRKVANSMLVVERPAATTAQKSTLTQLISQSKATLVSKPSSLLEMLISDAEAVLSNKNAMPGDYTKAIMNLYQDTSFAEKLETLLKDVDTLNKNQYTKTVWDKLQALKAEADAAYSASGTSPIVFKDLYNAISAQILLTGAQPAENIALGKSYQKLNAVNSAYPDTGDSELTDGKFPPPSDVGGANWVGWTAAMNSTVTVTVDLKEVRDDLIKFKIFTEDANWGIFAPSKVEFFVSEDNTNFTSVGTASYESEPDRATYTQLTADLVLDQFVTGRYVKMVATSYRGFIFISEIEIYNGEKPAEGEDSSEPQEESSVVEDSSAADDESPAESSAAAESSVAGEASADVSSTPDTDDNSGIIVPIIIVLGVLALVTVTVLAIRKNKGGKVNG